MIKQIQLRGISHSPSDRLTADGGVEDCIDLRLEDQEHGPAKAPVNVTESLAPGLSSSGIDVMFLHKGSGYTNYVGIKVVTVNDEPVNRLAAYVYNPDAVGANADGWVVEIITSGDSFPEIVSTTSIGNILVVVGADGKTYYSIFKNRTYKYLGTEIPRPDVGFSVWGVSTTQEAAVLPSALDVIADYKSAHSDTLPTPLQLWAFTLENKDKSDSIGMHADKFYSDTSDAFWGYVDRQRRLEFEDDVFCAPVLARYAVKLYDGSYIYVSEPILLSNGQHMHVSPLVANVPDTIVGMIMLMNLNSTFSARVSVQYDNVSIWKDVIESVDVFISQDILVPPMRADLIAAKTDTGHRMDYGGYTYSSDDIIIGIDGADGDIKEAFETKMLEASNFYKVVSFDMTQLPSGTGEALKPCSQDDLVVRTRLEEGDSHMIAALGVVSSYNERLVTRGQKVTLSPGYERQHSPVDDTSGTQKYYRVFYHVRDSYGEEHLVDGFNMLQYDSECRAYIAYPDPKCFQADLYYGTSDGVFTTMVALHMKEHPRLNCSYGFWGLDKNLDAVDTGESVTGIPPATSRNPVFSVNDRLAMSEMDNPFVFPLGQRERFTARILQVVPATIALSAFQSGPLPLYIFTEDGIWAESITDEGKLANKFVVSRDVAVEGTITQLDRAVVFVSGQGIMYLEGNQVACLSPYMNGPQYTIAEFATTGSSLRAALTRDGFDSLLDISVDTTDFQDFALACKPLYDYANKRILFFKSDEDYGYEYALDTQTWHKVSVPASFVRTLNGYPQAYAVFGGAIYDWSVRHDYNAAVPVSRKGWLLTRPFDLGEPDVRKAIRSIRIRGRYDRNNVRYLLFGSFDGIHWQRLISLRGGSYKMFRILLLTDLTPEERVSWIDVDYESRFQTKLR